ncbi:MAG TPA: alpha/beta hydrolase [Caulobacter sp.]|nr:alpha/beta hydrolase [Caulobacter sp.]
MLVHGAWHGGWCWKWAAQRLGRDGHVVYTPTLTGLGDRAHLARDDIDLTTHVRDIARLLEYEDLRNVILVGHSYSGLVITGVAAQAADRLAALVYLDAFLPSDGDAFIDLAKIPNLPALVHEGLVPPMLTAEQLGLHASPLREWAMERIGGHPWRCFAQPLHFSTDAVAQVPLCYVRTSDLLPHEAAKAGSGFLKLDMRPAGHDVMLTEPDALAELLVAAGTILTQTLDVAR